MSANNLNEYNELNIYLRALTGMFEKMLKYANCNHQADPSNFKVMKDMVNQIYATEELGKGVFEKLERGFSKDIILNDIEREYKDLSIKFKNLYKDSLNSYFENELEADFSGNNFANPQDKLAFEILKKQVGSRVFAQILAKAVQGDSYYQQLLGKSYFLGWGTPVNIHKGLNWLKIAAESGDPETLLLAGIAEETYSFNQTGLRLNENSVNYYKQAYEKGNPDAAYALYRYYKNYLSSYASIRESRKWFNRGIEDGSKYCQYIEELPPKENWVPRNIKNVLDWIKAAAEFKEPDAYLLLSNLYGFGNAGLEQDKELELEYLQLANRNS